MCLTPIRIKGKKNEDGIIRHQGHAIVPCGKCPVCRQKRANAWVFRLLQQAKAHKVALFITLTYSNENVRMTPKGYMNLHKRDLQLFFKRLRKNTGCKTIKYYACGEYGTDSYRPHYHAIIFDATSDDIQKAWQLGQIYVGTVTGASIGYTTKYICKESRIPLHANDDRRKEFALMSLGMGKPYLTPQMIKWHNEQNASYVVVDGGHKQPLPRYYRDFIFNDDKKLIINHKNQLKHQQRYDDMVSAAGSVTEMYRVQFEYVREQLQIAKTRELSKRNKI